MFSRLPRLLPHLPAWLIWIIFWVANQKFLAGAAVIVFNDTGQVLLFKHTYRGSRFAWGLPGGWMKRGESPEEALVREVWEESRLRIRVLHPVSIKSSKRVPRLDFFYLGKLEGGEFAASNEVSEVQFFDLDHLPYLLDTQRNIILQSSDQGNGTPPDGV